ncbi:hypothetical protein, partial [Thiolapillus sp.]
CGGSHAPRQCPAYGTTCSKCHKKNHWRQVCRSGGGATPSSNSSRRNATFQQKKKKRGGLPHRNYGQWRKTVNAITDDSGDDYSSDLEHLEFSSIEKDSGDDRDELYASLDIIYKRPASLKVKVDTGAQGNILPLRIFRRMFPERLNPNGFPAEGTTETRRTILHAYNGTPIKQFGVINLSCKYRDSDWQNAEFFVTESEGSAILGLPSSRQLRLVTVHCAVQKVSTSKKQPIKDASHLKHMYPDRFEGIGDFEGELHITLQEGAKAVVQPPRKYPIQLLDEIKSELEKMERLDVITPVTEPTDWVNALAFSRKSSGGLR